MLEKYASVTNFKFFNRWFNWFCRRNKLSLRRKTHVSRKTPLQLKLAVQKFHSKLLREGESRTFTLCDIVNLYQTPLPFVLDDGRTYDAKGFEEVDLAAVNLVSIKAKARLSLTL